MLQSMHCVFRRLLVSPVHAGVCSAAELIVGRSLPMMMEPMAKPSLTLRSRKLQTTSNEMTMDTTTHYLNHRHRPVFHGDPYCRRRFSTTASASTTDSSRINTEDLLETWCYEVDTFGSLDVNVPFDVVIECLNPQKYPEMNKAFVKLYYDTTGLEHSPAKQAKDRLQYLQELYQFTTAVNEAKTSLSVAGSLPRGVVIPLLCHIEVPMKFGIQVVGDEESKVTVRHVESDKINISQCSGNTLLHNVKCGQISVCSVDGDIISEKLLQGNIQLQAGGSGCIHADRLQGNSISCGVEQGGLDVKSIYAAQSHFVSTASDVRLRSCHGKTSVQLGLGSLSVGTLDGDLIATVEDGSVDVYAARHNLIDIKVTKGDITLRLPETATTMVLVNSETFACDEQLQTQPVEGAKGGKAFLVGKEKAGPQMSSATLAASKGVMLMAQDWFSTLKLQSD